MPHFHGLRVSVTPRTGSASATRSAAGSPPQNKNKKPVHFRWCNRGSDLDGPSTATEDYKRPRAVSPSPRGTMTRVPDDEDDDHQMSHNSETVPVGSQHRHVESIYSLGSPWMEDVFVASREKIDGTYGEGGARAQCVDEERRHQQHHQHRQREGLQEKRFFSALVQTTNDCTINNPKTTPHITRHNSSVSSVQSEPMDIPGARSTKEDSDDSSSLEFQGLLAAHSSSFKEEGWVSMWNTYTRLCPGKYIGCSPPDSKPPPDSPLYASSPPNANGKSDSGLTLESTCRTAMAPTPAASANLGDKAPTATTATTATPTSGRSLATRTTPSWTTPKTRGHNTPRAPRACDRRFFSVAAAAAGATAPQPPPPPLLSANGKKKRSSYTPRTGLACGDITRHDAPGCLGGGGVCEGGARTKPVQTTLPPPSSPPRLLPLSTANHSCQRSQKQEDRPRVLNDSNVRSGGAEKTLMESDDDQALAQEMPKSEKRTKGYSWRQLSQMPLEEAGKVLGTFSAAGFSAGAVGGHGEDDAGERGTGEKGGVCGYEGLDDAEGQEDDDLEDSDSFSATDLDSLLMFDLEM